MNSSKTSQQYNFDEPLHENQLEELYIWLDAIPLSRKKKNLSRDFSDAILACEIIKFHFPKLIELHNYSAVNSRSQKITNWSTLNRKVLIKLDMQISIQFINKLVDCAPNAIESFLHKLWRNIEHKAIRNKTRSKYGVKKNHNSYSTQTSNTTVPQSHIQSGGPNPIPQSNHLIRPPDQRMVSQVDLVEMGRSSELSLNQLDLSGVNMHTRMILEEKEQALLASQETIQILQVKIKRLEQLLQLKNERISQYESNPYHRINT